MYLRKIKRPQGIYLAIQESYYDSTTKQSRTRTVESLGYLDALKKEYDDPIAHFTTCFTALVLIRLLQAKLDNKYPAGRVINSLKDYCCVPLDMNNYQFTYFDEILQSIGKAFDMSLDNKYRTRQEIQRLLRY